MTYKVRWVKYLVISVIFMTLGLVYSREMPVLKRWLFSQAQNLVKEKAGLQISSEKLNFTLFPPGIELENLKISPLENELAQVISPIKMQSFKVSLNPLALLAGRFEIGKIHVLHPEMNFFLKANKGPEQKSAPFVFPWDEIIHLPIRHIHIEGALIQGDLNPLGLLLKLENFGLRLTKSTSAAQLEIFAPHLFVKRKSSKDHISEFGLATRMIFEKEAAELAALKISFADSFVIARAQMRGPITNLKFHTAGLRTIGHLKLEPVLAEIEQVYPNLKLPHATGQFNFEIGGTQKKNALPAGHIDVDAQNLTVEQFKIGQIRGTVNFEKGQITTKLLEVKNSAGSIQLKDLTLGAFDENKFSGRLLTENLVLETFLENIDVGKPPLHMGIGIKSACEGRLKPEFKLECAGTAEGKDFRVYTEPENKTIVAINHFDLLTRFQMDKGRMIFPDGDVRIGSSSGKASGVIDFENGFTFTYSTPGLDFKDIQSLADLHYLGKIEISGATKGDGHSAVFNHRVKFNDFWFENYGFGAGEFDMNYETSQLFFKNIKAGFKNTDYSGEAAVTLNSPSKISFNLDFPRLNLEDLTHAFSKKVDLGFDVSGQGRGHIDGSGPLELSKLDYRVISQIDSGVVYGENFKNFVFNVHAQKGHAFSDDIQVRKGDSILRMKGDVSSNGIMSLQVLGDGLHLFDIDYIRNNFKGLDGQMRFDLLLQGQILNPLLSLRGQISQGTLNQDPLEDSSYSLDYGPEKSILVVNGLGDQIKVKMVQPRQRSQPSELTVTADKWDFSPIISMLSGSDFKKDYDTLLTGHIQISSPTSDYFAGTGSAAIDKLFIRHGGSQMENKGKLEATLKEGLINVQNFELSGNSTELKISGNKDKKDNLKFTAEGSLDLSLFAFLTPFFQDMRGTLKLNAQVAGKTAKPEFLGNAFINKGYFKLKTFPHPFEEIKSDILFSQSRVVINSIKGLLGGGELSAAGNVFIKDFRDIPVDIAGDLSHTTLNIPEGLTTTGTGRFRITGNWFPYLLKADHNIESGLYSKNFGTDTNSELMKRSTFLPKNILLKESSSLEFDLNTHFSKGVTVRNNLVDTDVKGNLKIKGDTQKSILTGELETLPGGKFYFRETPFSISSAKVKFDNPAENNPQIYAVGTSRVREWDVSLIYQGTLDKHEIKLSSTPPLPERSIVSLLALGTTDDDLEKTRSNSLQALQGYQAGGVLLEQNPLLQDFKRKTGVVVKFTQSVDDTRNIISPHFVAQKDWTPNFSTSLGRTTGSRSSNDFKMEYRLNRNISVLGSYEQRDYDQFSVSTLPNSASLPVPAGTQPTTTTDIFGVDLQYQLEFR